MKFLSLCFTQQSLKVIFALLCISFVQTSAQTTVSISGRDVLLNGQRFWARGVCYGICPLGQWMDSKAGCCSWDWQSSPPVYLRDLPLLQEMNVNMVRLYGWRNDVNHDAFLNECFSRGIYVIVSFGWNWDLFNQGDTGRQQMRNSLVSLVRNHANHPAVLMWAIGNELNMNRGYQPEVWDFVRELAQGALTTPRWHPVGSPVADGSGIWDIVAARNNDLDVWMVPDIWYMSTYDFHQLQPYRGRTFGDVWTDYNARSQKPLFLTEFGVDAYHQGGTIQQGEAEQAEWDIAAWDDILAHSTIASGGSVFQYADGWFKCLDGSTMTHDMCGGPTWATTFPDDYAHQEWFGLMTVQNTQRMPDGGDTLRPRPAFCSFVNKWLNEPRYVSYGKHDVIIMTEANSDHRNITGCLQELPSSSPASVSSSGASSGSTATPTSSTRVTVTSSSATTSSTSASSSTTSAATSSSSPSTSSSTSRSSTSSASAASSSSSRVVASTSTTVRSSSTSARTSPTSGIAAVTTSATTGSVTTLPASSTSVENPLDTETEVIIDTPVLQQTSTTAGPIAIIAAGLAAAVCLIIVAAVIVVMIVNRKRKRTIQAEVEQVSPVHTSSSSFAPSPPTSIPRMPLVHIQSSRMTVLDDTGSPVLNPMGFLSERHQPVSVVAPARPPRPERPMPPVPQYARPLPSPPAVQTH